MILLNRLYTIEPVRQQSEGLIIFSNVSKSIGTVTGVPQSPVCRKGDAVWFNVTEIRREGDMLFIPEKAIVAVFPMGNVSLENMVIPSNHVLVKITHDPSEIDVAGHKLFIDTTYKKEFHAPTYGVVIKNPVRLICRSREKWATSDIEKQKEIVATSLPWDTDMETNVGDVVHFDYLTTFACERDGLIFEEKGEKYYLINYSQLYASENGGDLRLLNGYMAVDIEKDEKVAQKGSVGLIQVDLRPDDKKKQWGKGKVVYAGSPNRGYILWEDDEERIDVIEGDYIVFKSTKRSKFGQDMHMRCEKLKGLYRVQRKDIHYKIA